MKDIERLLRCYAERVEHYRSLNGPVEKAFRNAAEVREGDLEVDDEAVVSLGSDPGAYVMSWQWVPNDDAGVKEASREKGSEELEESDLEKTDGQTE